MIWTTCCLHQKDCVIYNLLKTPVISQEFRQKYISLCHTVPWGKIGKDPPVYIFPVFPATPNCRSPLMLSETMHVEKKKIIK